jgi:Zn-dependent protease with chaperone function
MGCYAIAVRELQVAGILCVAALLLSGCAADSGTLSVRAFAWAPWAERQGGLLAGPTLDRVERSAARLDAWEAGPVSVRVLASDLPGAYAWPDGSLFVTRRLVLMLDDDELTAVLAHEMGHLCADHCGARQKLAGSGYAVHALSGGDAVEEAADSAACALLSRGGIAPGRLARALEKVRDAPSTTPACRKALSRRIEAIEIWSGITSRDAERAASVSEWKAGP